MKILLAADIIPPQAGGPATYVVMLANELEKRGDEVRIVSLNPQSDSAAVRCPVEAVKSQNKLLRYWQYFLLLWKRAKLADVVYAMGPVNAGFPALLASKLRGKRLAVKIVGDYAWEQYQNEECGMKNAELLGINEFQKGGGYSLKIKILRFVEKFVARESSAIIVPSLYLKRLVVGWGLSEHCVSMVHNEVEYVSVNSIEHENEKWVVSVGRLTPWKGMDTLIEIMPDLLKENFNLKLKIVGDGPMIGNLRKKIKDLNLENSVELTGNLPKTKTLTYMASANVFVLNSGYEGYAHVLIEALNQGVPVLASRVGGNDEVAAGEALFEYNNKKEIKEKILANINTPKREPIRHAFFMGGTMEMINHTKELLQQICQN